jgi:Na+/phosphate symporter
MLQIFTLLGALGMFLYGMNLMSSGLLTLALAISVIMGANIGTTVTAWLGFKADISILAVPLMALGFLHLFRWFVFDEEFGTGPEQQSGNTFIHTGVAGTWIQFCTYI